MPEASGSAVPQPSATQIDFASRELVSSIVVVGAGAIARVREIHRQAASSDGIDRVDEPGVEAVPFAFVPLALGDIRGWKTVLNLYGFSDAPHLALAVENVVRNAAAIIVVQDQADGASNVMRGAKALRASGCTVPCSILASDALLAAWTKASGNRPVFHAPVATAESFSSALKSVMREILSKLRE